MKYLPLSTVVLASLLFGQCKKPCAGITESSVKLDPTEVKSLTYLSADSVFYEENSVLKVLKIKTPRQYFNSFSPDNECDASVKLEGSEIVFTDSLQQIKIYHNQSVSAEDTSTSQFHITYQNRTFLFSYSDLTQPRAQLPFTINGITYQNVFRLRSINDSIYFNRTHGIIRIKLQTGQLLQLHP